MWSWVHSQKTKALLRYGHTSWRVALLPNWFTMTVFENQKSLDWTKFVDYTKFQMFSVISNMMAAAIRWTWKSWCVRLGPSDNVRQDKKDCSRSSHSIIISQNTWLVVAATSSGGMTQPLLAFLRIVTQGYALDLVLSNESVAEIWPDLLFWGFVLKFFEQEWP